MPGFGSAAASSLCVKGQFSIGAVSGIGNGPGSDSSGYSSHAQAHPRLVRRHDDEVHVEVEAEPLVPRRCCG